MDVRFDEKGKYFTQRVTKDTMIALIHIAGQLIVGSIYVRPDKRIKDEINEDTSRFLPVTDARVYDATDNTLLYMTGFLLIAYNSIHTITPLEEVSSDRTGPWQIPNPEG